MQAINFWAQNFDEAAAMCQKYYPEVVEETILQANQVCKQEFVFRGHWEMERTHIPVIFDGEIDWEFIPEDDLEWMYAFNRLSFFVVLGKAWRYTGDEKYVVTFVKQMRRWLQHAIFTPEAKKTTWRSIEAGLRCKNILLAIALMQNSPHVTKAFLLEVEESLQQHAIYLLEEHGDFQQLSNWGVLQDHGLFLLGAYFANKQWQEVAIKRLEEELFHQVLADGMHWEQSPLYHCEVLQSCLDVILVAKRLLLELPEEFLRRTYDMSKALASMVRPDGLLLCQSDSDEVDARDILLFAAVLFKDINLKAVAGEHLWEENVWDFADLTLEYKKMPIGKRLYSTVLSASGNSMLRANNLPQADFLHMHCGSLGSGHGHADLLHIDLVSNGESILADSGRYTYVDCPLREQLKSPAGHNTILVDEHPFTIYQNSWAYKKLAQHSKSEYRLTLEVDYVAGTHLGYQEEGVLPRREVLRLGEHLWVIWDTLLAFDAKEHKYQHIFHFGAQGNITVSPDDTVHYQGRKASACFSFCGDNLQLETKKAPISLEYNKLEESDCLCVNHQAGEFSQLATVVATGNADAEYALKATFVPVTLKMANKELPVRIASALKITLGDDEWTVINCHNEVISEVDFLCANGKYGYGRVLVFGPNLQRGVCLLW